MKMLAIVIPFYKIKFFEETIASLEKQTNDNFNVYIGNDNSPEDPEEIIDSFRKDLDITYKKFRDNLGGNSLSAHWERCIEMTGEEEWIMVLGDDDVLQDNVISSWYDHLDLFISKTNLVRFSSKLISGTGEEISGNFHHPTWETAPDAYFRKHQNITRSSLPEYIFSKEAFQKQGFHDFPLAWHSDDRAWLEFAGNLPIYTINEATVLIRVSPASISGNNENVHQKTQATKEFLEYLILKKLSVFTREQAFILIRSYENFLEKNDKNTFRERLLLLFIYLKNYESRSFKTFLKRSLKSLMKPHQKK
ncbi:glycosyltransferase family 2 protein [Salinimicrobium sp. TIG7-5_MAKvit]|uniref:glycosyltransferase family 2 protein n=1 Tax=Salinimicrobium sp. TIG7-5_MAKvit TaxID=3121289 RepID=UPI003C6DDAA0